MTTAERDALFELWMRDHVAIIHRVANGFALGADRHDLMQELMLAVWKAIPAFRAEAKPSTFLYRVTHNAALTWKRTRANYGRKLEQLAAVAATQPPPGGSPAERDTLERIYVAIHQLPEMDRSLMLLSLDGVSYREMAQIHGLSESNVGVRLNRIKARLAESLEEPTHDPE